MSQPPTVDLLSAVSVLTGTPSPRPLEPQAHRADCHRCTGHGWHLIDGGPSDATCTACHGSGDALCQDCGELAATADSDGALCVACSSGRLARGNALAIAAGAECEHCTHAAVVTVDGEIACADCAKYLARPDWTDDDEDDFRRGAEIDRRIDEARDAARGC